MGRTSQRKGRNAELRDLKEWRELGYHVRDRRGLEAGGVTSGVDYEVATNSGVQGMLFVQRKHGRRPRALAAYREVAQACRGTAAIGVAHVTEHRGVDVGIVDWKDLLNLVQLAYPNG